MVFVSPYVDSVTSVNVMHTVTFKNIVNYYLQALLALANLIVYFMGARRGARGALAPPPGI